MFPDTCLNFDELRQGTNNASDLPVTSYAFLGDGVWNMLVRERLTLACPSKAGALHEESARMVNATYQCECAARIFEMLDADEKDIFIRGRNAHTAHTPRHKSKKEYHAATALEALFGWLYAKGRTDRIKQLFNCVANGKPPRGEQTEE